MTEFGVVTQVGRSIFLGVRNAHIQRGRGPTVPKIFETPADAETASTYSDEIWYANTCVRVPCIQGGQSRPIPRGQIPGVPDIFGGPPTVLPTLKWFDLQRQDLVW